MAITEVMPPEFKSMLTGPSLKVDVHTGALAEGILTFMITFAVLWIIIKGPSNAVVKTLMLATTTVTMVVAGSTYTGPSMNPINVSHLCSCVSRSSLAICIFHLINAFRFHLGSFYTKQTINFIYSLMLCHLFIET